MVWLLVESTKANTRVTVTFSIENESLIKFSSCSFAFNVLAICFAQMEEIYRRVNMYLYQLFLKFKFKVFFFHAPINYN